jgi:hypothetical protein
MTSPRLVDACIALGVLFVVGLPLAWWLGGLKKSKKSAGPDSAGPRRF